MENDILVIGIAGGTASGKTTLMRNLIADCEDEVTVLSHDNYYKRHDELSYEERCKLNYDEPDAFDTSLMVYHLDQLRHGHAIECPVYDFTVHNRGEQTIHLEPRRVIIVEGILIFESEALRNLMDIRIFVDSDADVRLCRRIKRDVNKRGRSLESVPVPADRQAHARALCGAQQKVCPSGGAGGREEYGGPGHDHQPDPPPSEGGTLWKV